MATPDGGNARRERDAHALRAATTAGVGLALVVFRDLFEDPPERLANVAIQSRIKDIALLDNATLESEIVIVLVLTLDPATEPETCALFDEHARKIGVGPGKYLAPYVTSSLARGIHAVCVAYERSIDGFDAFKADVGSPISAAADFEAWLADD